MESARRADDTVLPAIRRLAAQARAELGAEERGGKLFVGRETASEPMLDLDDPERVVVVGAIDDTVVGYAVARTEPLREGGLLGVVEELYVEPEARGVAVGVGMMDVLLAWFRERGCVGVDAAALPGARATKNFFERSGFSARLLVMHHRLGDPGDSA